MARLNGQEVADVLARTSQKSKPQTVLESHAGARADDKPKITFITVATLAVEAYLGAPLPKARRGNLRLFANAAGKTSQ